MRKRKKVNTAIDVDLALMYRVATWREKKDAELDELRAENKKLLYLVRLAGEFIGKSNKQYDKLLADVTGRVTTVKSDKSHIDHSKVFVKWGKGGQPIYKNAEAEPPNPGITRFHIGGITEIVDERIRG